MKREMIKKACEDNALFQQKTPRDNNPPKAGKKVSDVAVIH